MSQEPTIKRNLSEELSAAEKDLLGAQPASAPTATEEPALPKKEDEEADLTGDPNKLPQWAKDAIPDDLEPPTGVLVQFLRIRADKAKPGTKEDKVLVVWELSLKDERTGRQRCFGDSTRTYEEMAKMMIRAVSGKKLDAGSPDQAERIWDALGPRYRGILVLWYLRTHQLGDADRLSFFVEDVALRTMS